MMQTRIETRQELKTFRKTWRKGYRQVVESIRELKQTLKAKGENRGHNSDETYAKLQADLTTKKSIARSMMLGLIQARMQRQIVAAKEQERFIQYRENNKRAIKRFNHGVAAKEKALKEGHITQEQLDEYMSFNPIEDQLAKPLE